MGKNYQECFKLSQQINLAIRYKSKTDLLRCLKQSEDLTRRTIKYYNNQHLYDAIRSRDKDLVTILLNHGYDINNIDDNSDHTLEVTFIVCTDNESLNTFLIDQKLKIYVKEARTDLDYTLDNDVFSHLKLFSKYFFIIKVSLKQYKLLSPESMKIIDDSHSQNYRIFMTNCKLNLHCKYYIAKKLFAFSGFPP